MKTGKLTIGGPLTPTPHRAHLEASAERWSRLLGLLEELWRWICAKDEDLAKQMPIGGDVPTLLQQQNHCTVRCRDDIHAAWRRVLGMYVVSQCFQLFC